MTDRTPPAGRDRLLIDALTISRLDGIQRSFTLDDFTSGINLVHGPNASGKSRTATALQSLLWPKIAPPHAEITGRLSSGETLWDVVIDERGARHQRDDMPVDPPVMSGIPLDQRDRYLLTLHDLLQGDNRSLAEQIQRESTGGYDLNRARIEAGGTRSQPKPGGRREMQALHAARSARIGLQRHDAELQQAEQSLHRLQEQMRIATAARHRLTLIERALDHLNAREALAARQQERAAFADPIGQMTGREEDEIHEQTARLAALARERETIQQKIVDARQQRSRSGFGETIPSGDVVEALRQRQDALRELVAELKRHEDAIAAASASQQRRRSAIGDMLTDAQLEHLDGNVLMQLADLTRDFVRLDGEQDAQEALAAWLGDIAAPTNLPELRKGVDLLTIRLRYIGREGDIAPSRTMKLALFLAAGVVVIAAAVLAVEIAPYWAALAILALPLVWLAFRREPSGNAVEVARLERDFDSLATLPHPATWDEGSITRILNGLRESLVQAELDDEKAKRWADLAGKRQRVSELALQVAGKRDALRNDLGVVPAVDGDWDALRRIGENLNELRRVTDDVAAATDKVQQTEVRIEAELQEVNKVLCGAGTEPVSDIYTLGPRIDALHQRMHLAEAAETAITTLEQEIARRIEPEQEQLRLAISARYRELGIEDGDGVALRALCEQVPGCQEAEQRVRDARNLVESIRRHLAPEPDLAELDRDVLERLHTEVEIAANRHDDLMRQHATIESEVALAKQQTQIEDASAKEHAARTALQEARDESYAKSAAWNLAEFIHQQTRDLNRPPVYREAQHLFASFTSGAFTLEFGDALQPVFLARESATGAMLELDALSSGTRVQLLMAVRLAFIEMLEHGYRLPLLLDETLGNTDDTRISAIIDATIEISRRGRQIVYFTAQHEEIAKWQYRLDHAVPPLPHKVFDLEDIRGLAGSDSQSIVSITYTPVSDPPVPEHLDHAGARRFFRVAPIDPWLGHLDGAHLWYFITDVPVLVRFRELGLDRWGQFREMRDRHSLAALVPDVDSIDAKATVRYRVIASALEFWRVGRSRPLNRHDLLQSRAFYSRTIDEGCALGERCHWDGPAMLVALQAGEIAGVTSGRIEKFEQFLLETDRLTTAEPYSARMIRAQVLAAMRAELDEAEIDAILQTLD